MFFPIERFQDNVEPNYLECGLSAGIPIVAFQVVVEMAGVHSLFDAG